RQYQTPQLLATQSSQVVPKKPDEKPADKVGHTGILQTPEVEQEILHQLGQDISLDRASTGSGFAWSSSAKPALAMFLDPVDGFLVDGNGERLGFSHAAGSLAEIPGSSYFGDENGTGFVLGNAVVGPLRLELTGVGGPFFASVRYSE